MEYQTHPAAQDGNHSTSNLAAPNASRVSYTVGNGGMEMTVGHGMKDSIHGEYTNAPEADTNGYVFSTEAGSPVPNGQPRMHDMVEVHGIKIKVAQALRDGFIPQSAVDPSQAPQVAPQPNQQAAPQQAQNAPAVAAESLADTFTEEVLPRVSPATTESIVSDMMEGTFSEKTTDYLKLEGGMSDQGLADVRDAFAAKITGATGMDETELQDLWSSDRQAFTQAVSDMLKTGSTAAFQSLAGAAQEAAWVPLSNDEAMTAWQSQDFPQALLDAGLEPHFEGGEVSIQIPGRGLVKWTDAVSQGLVKVSRA